MNIESILKRSPIEPNVYAYWFDVITFECGRRFVSIQASELHYSHPRRNTTVEHYEAFEVLIEVPYKVLQHFPENEELQRHRIEMNIYGFVPKALVESLVNYLATQYTIDTKERKISG